MYSPDPDTLFVYGSLMPGGDLHHIIAAYTENPQPATAVGLMFQAKNHSLYPYVIFGTQGNRVGTIHGIVLTIREGLKDRLFKTLDAIEGHPHHYKRIVKDVVVDHINSINAWVYDTQSLSHIGDPIPSGRWEL